MQNPENPLIPPNPGSDKTVKNKNTYPRNIVNHTASKLKSLRKHLLKLKWIHHLLQQAQL